MAVRGAAFPRGNRVVAGLRDEGPACGAGSSGPPPRGWRPRRARPASRAAPRQRAQGFAAQHMEFVQRPGLEPGVGENAGHRVFLSVFGPDDQGLRPAHRIIGTAGPRSAGCKGKKGNAVARVSASPANGPGAAADSCCRNPLAQGARNPRFVERSAKAALY